MNRKDVRSEFEGFVKRQQRLASENKEIDWRQQRHEWLTHLRKLYAAIESFLEEYIKDQRITLRYREVELNEENIGSYIASQMILTIGRQEIVLKPVGTLLIGAKGRVDIIGPAGRTRLMLVDSEASEPTVRVTVSIRGKTDLPPEEPPPKTIRWAWKIVTSPPAIRFLELTQESFLRAVIEVANG